jgi:hypothetical protein
LLANNSWGNKIIVASAEIIIKSVNNALLKILRNFFFIVVLFNCYQSVWFAMTANVWALRLAVHLENVQPGTEACRRYKS